MHKTHRHAHPVESWHCQISEASDPRILREHFHGTLSRLVDVAQIESRTQKNRIIPISPCIDLVVRNHLERVLTVPRLLMHWATYSSISTSVA